ncbi:MAG TPA: hypothetical protein DIW41_11640 [Lachnospiraceae bacterium]|nr:hypothetical protein [Lachnospiraceae bacterium]
MKKLIAMAMALLMLTSATIVNASAAQRDGVDAERLTCERVEELPDGGHIYTYLVRGIEHHYPVPPAGFNPITATDEQLETYCFPRRPVTREAEAMNTWLALIENYTETPIPVISIGKKQTQETQQTPETRSISSSISRNWSGYSVSDSIYTQVQMDYTEPTITSAVSGAASCEWVGIGGYPDAFGVAKLVQAGTVQFGTSSHKAWYEYLNNSSEETNYPMTYIDSLSINAGNSIHVYISFQRANNRFEYYIANNSTGKSQAMYIDNVPSDIFYDGTTAEWIVERPYNGAYMPLCNYGTITLKTCQFTTNANNTWRKVGDYNNDKITMYNDSGTTILSQPGSITNSDSFKCTWKAAR